MNPNWKNEFLKRFVWTRTPEGRGYLFDKAGEQAVDEVIMLDFFDGAAEEIKEEAISQVLKEAESERGHAVEQLKTEPEGEVKEYLMGVKNTAERFIAVLCA